MPRAAALLVLVVLSVPTAAGQPAARPGAPPRATAPFFALSPLRLPSPPAWGPDTVPRPKTVTPDTSAAVNAATRDTITAADTAAADTNAPSTAALPDSASGEAATPRAKKDPWTAVGLSAVLPGAGQVYTENYWKVPVILGLGGYWVYEWGKNNTKYKEYRDLYDQSIEEFPPYGNEQYLQLREAYKDQRDAFAWYLGILYLVNIVDAYVGAELYDFDVGPELGSGTPGARATLRIHL